MNLCPLELGRHECDMRINLTRPCQSSSISSEFEILHWFKTFQEQEQRLDDIGKTLQ